MDLTSKELAACDHAEEKCRERFAEQIARLQGQIAEVESDLEFEEWSYRRRRRQLEKEQP